MARKRRDDEQGERRLPSREEVLRYIAENPGRAGKRELARAFGVKGDDRAELKSLIEELTQEGLLARKGKKLSQPGALPAVAVLDIFGRDADGGLLARPSSWDEAADGKPPVVSIRQPKGRNTVIAGVGDRILAKTQRDDNRDGGRGGGWSARAIKVLDRSRDTVLGVVRTAGGEIRLEPVHKRQDEVALDADSLGEAGDGDLVEVQVAKAGRHGLRRGRVTRIFGSLKNEKAVSMIAIHANEIPHVFPDAVLAQAAAAQPIKAGKHHEDWRKLPLLTIDPADAKDHDDAIHAEPDPETPGGHVVTVAIADVSWYVRPGTPMDFEALKRGNSVYFPDRVVPMLPERISNDLCSLRENEDRPALAVRMWFGSDGRKRRHAFHRIIMRSHAKLAYLEAQAAIDGKPGEKTRPILENVLAPLWEAYRCLRRGRESRAPLELDLPERKILLKPDGTVDRVVVPERLDAHKLVEEFMIQANVAAAETLEQRKQALVYRVHDAPSLDKLESLREFLKSLNMDLARSGNLRAAAFNQILARVEGSEREELVNQVILRSQSQAEYSPQNIGHFGLNLLRYAHFTSPIRRYADLIVHRALVAALGLGEGAITPEQEGLLDVIAADISVAERRAMQAERETVDRLIAGFLSERIGERFEGRINGVTRAGLFVTLTETGADGFVPISSIGDEYFRYDQATHSIAGDDTGITYQMGQGVEVRLVEAAPVAGALRFEILGGGKPGKSLQRSRRTNERGKPAGAGLRGADGRGGGARKRRR